MRKLFAAALASLPLATLAQTAPAAEPAPAAPAAPAAAPAPLAQVYGTLNVNLQYTSAESATNSAANAKPRFAVSTDSTNVGVRGSLDLSHGYKGVYQCETSANLDGEGVSGICNRNSRVGLTAFWGTLFYGNWDTPMKNAHYGTKADDPFGNTDVFGFQGIMGSPGYGGRTSSFIAAPTKDAPISRTASFDQRGGNTVAYWSPKFSGLGVRVQYSVDEFSSKDGTVRPQLLGASVNYDMGPLSVFATGEYHQDAFGLGVINPATGTPAAGGNTGTQESQDIGWRVGAGYDLPLGVGTLNVMGMVEQLSYGQENATGTATTVLFKDYSRFAWLVGAKFKTGNHEFRGRYSMAMNPSITAATGSTLPGTAEDDLGASSYAVGYSYQYAKSTQVYLFFTQIMNQDRASYSFGVGGSAPMVGTNTPVGSSPMAAGAGIRLAF